MVNRTNRWLAFLFLATLLSIDCAWAIPAHPGKVQVLQPDGTSLTIRLVGDEFIHMTTTTDGYTVLKNAEGFYVYAEKQEGKLVTTNRIARNEEQRTSGDKTWLQTIDKRLKPTINEDVAEMREYESSFLNKARQVSRHQAPSYDYNNFRGLIILVAFNDCEFSRPDYQQVIDNIVNQADYAGYDNTSLGKYTGSVRDYFYDSSQGMFAPQFDIVGPVNIDYSQYDANGMDGGNEMAIAAVEAADAQVDYSQYDTDKDGVVDMIYFIFAGCGSNYGGNDQRLIWPHAFVLMYRDPTTGRWVYPVHDGVRMGKYACSTELVGWSPNLFLDGIGTICHEFSHVLGLPDLYDTDYAENGYSDTPGDWSVMSGGSYLNNSRTPAGYGLYERYACGFTTPQKLTKEASYSLQSLDKSNQGYRIDSEVADEFFLLENRQKTAKWDAYLPGHGLLVFRVDSTDANVWESNEVNVNPAHNYYEMLRANGGNGAGDSDPFPGSSTVTSLTNSTLPANLLSWEGKETRMVLEDISESDGVISFRLIDTNGASPEPSCSATLSIEPFTICPGGTAEMLIDLNNASMNATLVQFDLRLPDGLTIATDDSGDLAADIAGRTTWKKHSLTVRTIGGITRFLLASTTNALISGTEGAVIKVTLLASNDLTGGDIRLEQQLITAPDQTECKPDTYTYTVTATTPQPQGSATLSIEPFTITLGGTTTMLIDLNNANMEATLVQFDLRLPEGLAIATDDSGDLAVDIAGRTTWKKHSLTVRTIGGVTRFLLASTTNALISGTEGSLISVTILAASDFELGVIRLQNQLITAPDQTESKPETYTYTIYPQEATLSIDLPAEAWGWVSSYLANGDLQRALTFLAPVKEKVHRLVSQTQELVNDPDYGLVGNLQLLTPQSGYILKTSGYKLDYTWTGAPCLPSDFPVAISKGWNWIGYIPLFPLEADDALASLQPSQGDILIDREQTHTYSGGAWIPSLTMLPGQSYRYKAKQDGLLTYPDEPVAANASSRPARRVATMPLSSPWTYSIYKYPDNMGVIAQVSSNAGAAPTTYSVAAFCGDECRGIGRWYDDTLFLTVHGQSGDLITFRAYDPMTGETIDVAETMVFASDCLGTLDAPQILTLKTVATSIGAATAAGNAFDIYTVGGQLVRQHATSMKGLPTGVYIANGKKRVIQ